MYRIERKDGRVIIKDWNDQTIYSASEDSYVISKLTGTVNTSQLKSLTDAQLLMHLATVVKLDLESK